MLKTWSHQLSIGHGRYELMLVEGTVSLCDLALHNLCEQNTSPLVSMDLTVLVITTSQFGYKFLTFESSTFLCSYDELISA